ncbi:MAG: GNAT family N-acetyltransferase [Chloroflexi bacterium]|nr:GNAT family N-acetyltransferase [Chloroflexota bacterium]MBK6708957.1 GNAT family N-acetyltransferase [Chloroflexota bacterium]MBK7914737.1 GNAT family N-acetyltransferase [Chloroflexota bacterium]MBK8934433.1 GNAT family N-acetyltransferase [Chloroflexota bacterium]MBP6805490.1 GNAT family N-acetyltransferase [Chloroflexota bacterium]
MDPILLDIPHQFESERLLIRCPLPGDGPALATAVQESLPELRPWLPWAVQEPSAEDSEINVRRGYTRFINHEDLWLILLLKGTDTIIGGSGLHRIDWEIPKFEIGYWLRTSYTGKGYITEAVAAIADFAFQTLGAKRVEIHCDSLNHRSAAVPQRLNFVHEGTLRCHRRNHLTNELRDTLIFAKTAVDE